MTSIPSSDPCSATSYSPMKSTGRSAKVQSALLEVMQEKQVTIGGSTFEVTEPFLVMATQNPIESEGTYPLPEAQVDRFMMKIVVDYPNFSEEMSVVQRSLVEPADVQQVLTAAELLAFQKTVSESSSTDSSPNTRSH